MPQRNRTEMATYFMDILHGEVDPPWSGAGVFLWVGEAASI
jgi:hypothetical protein